MSISVPRKKKSKKDFASKIRVLSTNSADVRENILQKILKYNILQKTLSIF